ncbi:3-methyladenine DNA glycosylase [bacterium (Candidatus Blackallbacteria) CG17_big_fil_post_rev_8_21_14_2_50_48_46]|uniref:Putative 3-methyladenine DNA glycosylase n=1 Tax=bacterium (Candidatus Blackallbacteria) CG17_big_fil_post_rev_8_21_14_2_50_48_46 TaxID=2014261 RepID=A0A2M7GCH2_9BACT|nr:MAG: 3-methyladenine DNA glycosylase [bacterium (Candidatus Blackallbacteria) CG18_big_fil_WC_8_21_14_2_50_49_26]PIW19673.1 MAG: 3-methyladenine DNA glycosylase [bacterium (Candidatus Blackallbacteria) CG17_big_fil_post_rev_8_21_14_2_50_48_46]PIW44746.1 MAG: 3-methyladenine DNA glycosylase [bacterium (Candidatus Blackallbacteria) CG13_big_fil_rev_8_21_14_2_50_49_14]
MNCDFFARPVETVARELLGKNLHFGACSGRIVETEAYHESEPSCHAWQGKKTPRNRPMFAEPGTVYIYRIHQVFCLNLVCEAPGTGAAVLIRALEPLQGIAEMRQRRGEKVKDRDLANGPGKLCQALSLDLDQNGVSACLPSSRLYLSESLFSYSEAEIQITPRIGISKAQEIPWRFFVPPTSRAFP